MIFLNKKVYNQQTMNEVYGSGKIVKLLRFGRSGFIQDLFGKELYFNTDGFDVHKQPLHVGDSVVFRRAEKFDAKKGEVSQSAVIVEKL